MKHSAELRANWWTGFRAPSERSESHATELRPEESAYRQLGTGSDFSRQAILGDGFDFGTWQGATFSGVIGYRAFSVDYAQGEGQQCYGFDMVLHGPVPGLRMRFRPG